MPLAKKDSDPIGRKWDIDALSALCAKKGLDALNGKEGPILDAVIAGAALTLWHTRKEKTLADAAAKARHAIASGEALRRLQAGLM